MDIAFRPGNFAADPAYATQPVYRSQNHILILPGVPNPGNPGTVINEPSILAPLSPNHLFPVHGFVTATVLWRSVQNAPGEPAINELWFSISYNVAVRQPLDRYSGPNSTPYGPEQRLHGIIYVMRLPEVSVATVQRVCRVVH